MSAWFRKEEKPLHGARIEDYAFIGDLETAALVSREGSVDWLCWPSFSSGACFAALLGTADNGFWRICPDSEIMNVRRRYVPGTMILETTFETRDGEVCLTDFMPPRGQHSDVVRIVSGVRGKVRMRMDLVLRFDYGLTIPWVTDDGENWRAVAGPHMAVFRTSCSKGKPVKLVGKDCRTFAEFTATEGERNCFVLSYAGSFEETPKPVPVDAALEDTRKFWQNFSGKCRYDGAYSEAVTISLLALKAMTYRPTGGMVAAVTGGLPEEIGGERNWDYRYCWLRDTSFTLLVLLLSGYQEEAVLWRGWLLRAIAGSPGQMQTVYGLYGERHLAEWNVDWLPGYEHSQPVRIGNSAANQFQLDVYGEVTVALGRMPDVQDELGTPATQLEGALIDHLCQVWNMPDDGIWEVRGARQHFVHSKVMAWVALDRAVKHHERFDGKGDVKRWRKNRDMLHKEICDKGFSKKLNSFTQSYGSDTVDASCLRLVLVGFLPADDPRILGTIAAVEKYLLKDGLVRRYDTKRSPDGLQGSEGAFLPCSFWLVICYWLSGRKQEATDLFDRLLALRNDVGLLSEEYDPVEMRMLGNFPQALTHIALVHAAFTLSGQWTPEMGTQPD